MRELIGRFLPAAPGMVLDVGGGPGRYACWLAGLGYEVHLVDPVEKHVEAAREASSAQPEHPLASAALGDARSLDQADGSADAVLLMGPLYHLTDRTDRLAALREAYRVLKPGGVVIAKAINRFASLLDGLTEGYIDDPDFVPILRRDLVDGQHRGLPDDFGYFTTGYFHRPDELEAEVREAGFERPGHVRGAGARGCGDRSGWAHVRPGEAGSALGFDSHCGNRADADWNVRTLRSGRQEVTARHSHEASGRGFDASAGFGEDEVDDLAEGLVVRVAFEAAEAVEVDLAVGAGAFGDDGEGAASLGFAVESAGLAVDEEELHFDAQPEQWMVL